MAVISSVQVAAGALPFVFLLAVTGARSAQGAGWPRALIDGFLAQALLSDIAAETLGHFAAIGFGAVFAVWLVAAAFALGWAWRLRARLHVAATIEHPLGFSIVMVFVTVTLLIALSAAPNNWDSQTYHLARIEHWVQDRSLAFYPTAIPRQNAFGPLAEVLLLQTRVLSGGSAYYLLVQWLGMVVSVAAAFRIAGQLAGTQTQCWLAAVFVATLPIGILQSTSTQNDYVEAALLAGFVSLGLEAIDLPRAPLGLVAAAGCAGALAGLTKPIAFMLGAGFALWFAIGLARQASWWTRFARLATAMAVLAAIVGPFAGRLLDSPSLAAVETLELPTSFGVPQTLDTFMRHVVSNLATGVPPLDRAVVALSDKVAAPLGFLTHRADATDAEHPVYRPPRGLFIYHENTAPNQLHALLVILALVGTALRWPSRPTVKQLLYCATWVTGLLIFATLIRFWPTEVRYHLPGFVLAAPIVAMRWPDRAPSRWPVALMLVLAVASLPVLLFNKSRSIVPLPRALPVLRQDQPSYLAQSAAERLFANKPRLLAPYSEAVDLIIAANATRIGLVLGDDAWEYPMWWLLQRRGATSSVRIEHVATANEMPYPLGPFRPDIVFWEHKVGEPPATLSVGGREFRRILSRPGPPDTIALFAPADPSVSAQARPRE